MRERFLAVQSKLDVAACAQRRQGLVRHMEKAFSRDVYP